MQKDSLYKALPSQPSQEGGKVLKEKEKKAARVENSPSQTLATLAKPQKSVKAKAKAAKRRSKAAAKKPRTAADLRVREKVPASADNGALNGVERFVDTVELLYRRRQIDARQYQAAETYREAAERVEGGIPCPLDTSRVRGGGTITSPTEAQLWAAAMLSEAERILGKIDGRIVALVTGGMGIAEVAITIFGSGRGTPRQRDSEHVGRRLREALAALADAWWPTPPAGRIRAVRDAVEPAETRAVAGPVEAGRVAHATGRRVYYSD